MDAKELGNLILPLSLFLMMLGVGITLAASDFKQVWKQPKAVAGGVLGQLVVLPLLALLTATLCSLPGIYALGLLVIALSPGGVTSNMITLVARGDTALSVTLTALSSLITPFTLPLVLTMALAFYGESSTLSFPVLPVIGKLSAVTLVPVCLGIWLRYRYAEPCTRLEPWVKRAAVMLFGLMVLSLIRAHWGALPQMVTEFGAAVTGMALAAMLCGTLIGCVLGLNGQRQVTLAIEVGLQNAGTALMVTSVVIQSSEMSSIALLYGILMQFPAAVLMLWRNLPNVRRRYQPSGR